MAKIATAGPLIRLDLERLDDGTTIAAELTRAEAQELGLQIGEEVYVRPRTMRVFLNEANAQAGPEDYSI